MPTGVILLNFGEPETPSFDEVVPFLESIFLANARLEPAGAGVDDARGRARQLAERRAPALVSEYERIGGSPLNAQTRAQARALETELRGRGGDVVVAYGMQFTEPSIGDAVRAVVDAGADRLVALPLYPLCGPSTTVPALAAARRAVDGIAPGMPLREVSGWHADPGYVRLRAGGVRAFCRAEGLDLADPRTALVLSAHGTPLRYLEGSRYDLYVHHHARALARRLEVDGFALGFQNHQNRPGVEWTGPAVGDALEGLAKDADRVVVVPISFMNEQSETLVELDIELREAAEGLGLELHRVPIPWDDPGFVAVLADLVTGATELGPCACRDGAVCSNGALELRRPDP